MNEPNKHGHNIKQNITAISNSVLQHLLQCGQHYESTSIEKIVNKFRRMTMHRIM